MIWKKLNILIRFAVMIISNINMTDEEIADKLARIQANSQVNTDMALERILNGG